jgi:hypothetical protein
VKSARGLVLAFFVLGMVGPGLVLAGPPYQTDDPEPTETGHLEILVSATSMAEAGRSQGGLPQLQLNYGPMKDVQLSFSPQLAFSAPVNGPTNFGVGDTQVSVKYRFLHETDTCPQAAVFPAMVLPTGSAERGLGAGQTQVLLPMWFQKSWGPWTSFGGGGYWINPGEGNQNWTFMGAALQRDLGETVSLGLELFYHSAAQTDDVGGLGSNLALLWHLDGSDGLLFSAGRDVIWGRTTFTGFAAYQKVI